MMDKLLLLLQDKRFITAVALIVLIVLQQYVGGVDVPVVP